jgi:hypothetical protein
MQLCNRIYYSKVYWRLNMFRVAHRSSSGALNCICSLWFIYPCGDRPLSRLSGKWIHEYQIYSSFLFVLLLLPPSPCLKEKNLKCPVRTGAFHYCWLSPLCGSTCIYHQICNMKNSIPHFNALTDFKIQWKYECTFILYQKKWNMAIAQNNFCLITEQITRNVKFGMA